MGIHLLALLAFVPYFTSWTAVIVGLVAAQFFNEFGITLCYHRLLSHRSLKVPKWFERFLVFVGIGCLEDTPARWVTVHRSHHQHSDTESDPHTPRVSFWWAHVGWLFYFNRHSFNTSTYQKYSRDILEDPFYMAFEKNRWLIAWIYLGQAALFPLAGYLIGGTQMAWQFLVWGVFVRTVIVWHLSWSVNSLTHLWGYRSYDTPENSRNSLLLGILCSGDGWHNNHHQDPTAASTQRRWWELDLTYYTIKLLSLVGLATEVVPPREKRNAARNG